MNNECKTIPCVLSTHFQYLAREDKFKAFMLLGPKLWSVLIGASLLTCKIHTRAHWPTRWRWLDCLILSLCLHFVCIVSSALSTHHRCFFPLCDRNDFIIMWMSHLKLIKGTVAQILSYKLAVIGIQYPLWLLSLSANYPSTKVQSTCWNFHSIGALWVRQL